MIAARSLTMRSTLLLSLLVAAVGCGGHGLPSSDMAVSEDMSAAEDMAMFGLDIRQYVTFEQFAQDYAAAVCAHYQACGQLDAAQMSACVERNLRHSGWDQDIEVVKGRMEINEAQCLNAINGARCDNSDNVAWGSKCLQLLYIPHVAKGGACLADQECIDGSCQHAGSDGGMIEQVAGCPGTCADPKPSGAPCRLVTDCAPDSACEPQASGPSICVKLAALNDACENPFSPVADFTKQPCQFGLMCPTYPAAAPATCVIPTTQTAADGACDPFQGGVSPAPACGTGLYCQVQYTAGAACTGAPGDCATVPGAFCDTTAGMCQNPTGGKCKAKLASGAACDPHNEGLFTFVDNQCADGTMCYLAGTQASATCQAFGAANADCVKFSGTTSTCKVGLNCDATNKCVPWLADGQVCTQGSDCAALVPGQAVCIADNADAGTALTCNTGKSFGASCIPGFEDSLCTASDNANSAYCAPTSGGKGTCAPKCF